MPIQYGPIPCGAIMNRVKQGFCPRPLFAANVNAGDDNVATVAKYISNDFTDRANDIKLLRVAELLLIGAEAHWKIWYG